MEVILLEKQHMGELGDKVNVKAGFARNFLFPQQKAVPANKENVEKFAAMRAELEAQQAEKLQQAQQRGEAISALRISINAKAGEEGKLFGSIGTKDIADAITAAGQALEKSEVLLPNGVLRELGEHDVHVQLHPDVIVNVKIDIVAED